MEAVEKYQEQLKVIEIALKTSVLGPERDELLCLKQTINELLLLTTETANIINGGSSNQDNTNNYEGDCPDDEWALFMSEMTMETGQNNKQDAKDNKKIKDLERQKYRAPYNQKSGQMSYHNAMICSVPEGTDDIDNLQVKVVFLNPTDTEMLPCPYYFDMEQECDYDEDSCRYSHGQLVHYSDLKCYIEPKFENLNIGSNIIAKQEDDIWYKGKITRILKGKYLVRFQSKSSEQNYIFEEISLEHVLPMEQNEADGSEGDDFQIVYDDEEVTEMEAREKQWKHSNSLLVTPELEERQKHTKGFGFGWKLMQKMDHIVGTGLGKDGSGIIKPVSALILPEEKSLDFSMHLKDQSQNPNLSHVDNKVTQGKKKAKKNAIIRKIKKRIRLKKKELLIQQAEQIREHADRRPVTPDFNMCSDPDDALMRCNAKEQGEIIAGGGQMEVLREPRCQKPEVDRRDVRLKVILWEAYGLVRPTTAESSDGGVQRRRKGNVGDPKRA